VSLTPEGAVKAAIVKELVMRRDRGDQIYWFFPVASRLGRAGVPDLIVCYEGRFVAIEVKAAKGKPTALQLKAIDAINVAGGTAVIIKPTENGVSIAEQTHAALTIR
jgi:hypothetical protein